MSTGREERENVEGFPGIKLAVVVFKVCLKFSLLGALTHVLGFGLVLHLKRLLCSVEKLIVTEHPV